MLFLSSLGLCGCLDDDELRPSPLDMLDAATDVDAATDAASDAGGFGLDASDAAYPLDAANDWVDASDAGTAGREQGVVNLRNEIGFFVAAFTQGDRLWVIDAGIVSLYALSNGRELMSVDAGGWASGAAFDGTQLFVFSSTELTTIRASDLSVLAVVPWSTGCSNAILVQGRVICRHHENDGTTLVETVDVTNGEILATARLPHIDEPVRAVPQSDLFVASDGTRVGGHRLFRVGSDGVVADLGPPRGTNVLVGPATFVIDNAQPPHVITEYGDLLRIDPTCADGCFVPEGNLGLLAADQKFLALERDGPFVAAIIGPQSPDDPSYYHLLTTFDLASRMVQSQRRIQPQFRRQHYAFSLAHEAQRVVIASGTSYQGSAGPTFSGFRVDVYELD